MKFHLTQAEGNLFTGYGPGFVEINRVRHVSNLIALPDQIIKPWAPDGFDGLTAEHFEALLQMAPDVVLLGTGTSIRFPHPRLFARLSALRIGSDVMDTAAACRTFNVLVGEGRRVAAALLML